MGPSPPAPQNDIKKIMFKKSRAVAILKQKWGEHVENIKNYLGS